MVVLEIADTLRSVCVNHGISKLADAFYLLILAVWMVYLALYRDALPLFMCQVSYFFPRISLINLINLVKGIVSGYCHPKSILLLQLIFSPRPHFIHTYSREVRDDKQWTS